MSNQTVQVNARKYDGRLHRSWRAELVEARDQLLVLRGVFEENVPHKELGAVRKGTISYEYYWLDRWYNIFRFHEPDGRFRNHYCNINMPPRFQDNELDYVDLDLDILVGPDWKINVLDLREFHKNSELYEYPDEIKSTAIDQIGVLTRLIESRKFPFDMIL